MATLAQVDPTPVEPKLSLDEAADKLLQVIEGYYDDIGLSQSEREQRYASAREFLDSKADVAAKAG